MIIEQCLAREAFENGFKSKPFKKRSVSRADMWKVTLFRTVPNYEASSIVLFIYQRFRLF